MAIFQSTLSVRRATPIFDETYRAKLFQSTLSVRRATLQLAGEVRHADISIHDLRKESDTGERRQMAKLLLFQSTLSVRRATISEAHAKRNSDISIHALRKESDL